jgi:sodium/potassium/calcium exchanger 6
VITTIGFISSALWVYRIAQELVRIMQFISYLGSFNASFVGLTIFAMANSMTDFATNISLARSGFGKMALGACFGSPLLSMITFI